MLSDWKVQKGKMAIFLKQTVHYPTNTNNQEKQNQHKNKSKKEDHQQKHSYLTDLGINFDTIGNSTEKPQRNVHQYLYRSLESNKMGMSQRQSSTYQEKIGVAVASKSEIKRHKNLQSIDEIGGTRNKINQIPISTSKLKQKYDRNGISFMKLTNLRQQDNSGFSHNFNTYFEFKQFMSKLSTHCSNKKSIYQNTGIFLKNTRKCSIIPIKPKHKNSQSAHSSFEKLEQYLQTKKTKLKLQKSLIVESKKQELVSHIISKYKDRKAKEQRQDLCNNDEELSLKVEGVKKEKTIHNNKVTHQRNISFSFSNSEEGVYQQKIRTYRELLFILNFAHRIYDPLVILDATVIKLQRTILKKPTYYIGPGNNSMLVRTLMKRRIWWEEVKDYQHANFIWTQIKISTVFQGQKTYKKLEEQCQVEDLQENTNEKIQLSPPRKAKRHLRESKNQLSIDKQLGSQKNNEKQGSSYTNPKGLMFRAPFAVSSFEKILTQEDSKVYKKMMHKVLKGDIDNFQSRIKYLPKAYLTNKESYQNIQMHNHFECNHALGNKKALFYHMQLYYKLMQKPLNKAFPTTFHIRMGQNDTQFKSFLQEYTRISREQKYLSNIWILKPGQNSNRGSGITVVKELKEIKKLLRAKDKHKNGQNKTFILQKYIEKPLLYCGRKFDIRHYMIISGMHGKIRAYWYGEGYIRTSSYLFNLQEVNDPMIHLTNDAIQKYSQEYGSFEDGNKVSYNQLQKYFTKEFPDKKFDFNTIFSKMRELAKDAVEATYVSLDPNRRLHNLQVFGLDFMIDENLDVMLIEVNTNPCLELSSALLSRIIPSMVDQALRVTLDPIFPPHLHYTNNTRHLAPDCSLQKLQMQIIFDSERDGPKIEKLYEQHSEEYKQMMRILQGSQKQVDETFDNEGEEIEMQELV